MSDDQSTDDSDSASGNNLPSTEGEEEECNDIFTVTIRKISDTIIIPKQSETSNKLECDIIMPLPQQMVIEPLEVISIGLGFCMLPDNQNYICRYKTSHYLLAKNLQLMSCCHDLHTCEIIAIIQNKDPCHRHFIYVGEKIMRVIFRKKKPKELKFLIK